MKPLRLLGLIILLGFGAVSFGLYSLQQLIGTERNDALKSITKQQSTLSKYALRIFEKSVAEKLLSAQQQITLCVNNPFLDDTNIIFIEDSKQKLPRKYRETSTAPSPILIYKSLIKYQMPATHKATSFSSTIPSPGSSLLHLLKDPLWKKRLQLYRKSITFLKNKQRPKIETSIRKSLNHRSRYKLNLRFDIPSTIALLDILSQHGRPRRDFMQRLLLRAQPKKGKIIYSGLQADLLSNRNEFTQTEFKFLSDRIIALSQKHNINVNIFISRAQRNNLELPKLPIANHSYMDTDKHWLLLADNSGDIIGFKLNFNKVRLLIQEHMRRVGLIQLQDTIKSIPMTSYNATQLQALSSLPQYNFKLKIESSRWLAQQNLVKKRYFIKTSLIAITGLVSLLVVVLSFLHQKRKQQYIALKADFIQAISHELRTPLTSIRLMAETLEYRLEGIPEAKDYPGRIVKDIDGLSFMVENILSFNRLEKGLWDLERTDFNFTELVSTIESEIHLYTNKKVNITLHELSRMLLKADSNLLKMLLFNLVRNSCYYNLNDVVEIRIGKCPGHSNCIDFIDNGIGIDKENWKNVFMDFYRIHDKNRGNIRGSGLGLAICRKIMALHGGKIYISSSSPQGSCFRLVFGDT